jgi:DNA-binding MarR family transcriptional regulator
MERILRKGHELGSRFVTEGLLTDGVADPDAELAAILRLASMRLARRLRLERGRDDLTLSQLAVLGSLDRQGPATPGELAEIERVRPPSMTRIVNSLEEAGLVVRRPHPTDGRQVIVELTEQAHGLVEDDRRRRNAWLALQLEGLTEHERDVLRAAAPLLDRLAGS